MSSADENEAVKRLLEGHLPVEVEAGVLERIGRAIKGGDTNAILHGLRLCFDLNITPPGWLTKAFCKRINKAVDYESWDQAFGRPRKKGGKEAGRELKKHAVKIWLKVRELRASGMRGDEVFREAAADLPIHRDWQTVRDAYYDNPKLRGFLEWAAESVEAMEQEQIRGPDGAFKVSLDEYARWLVKWFEAHPAPPLPSSSSEKRPKIKRKIK
jgi:hypothetical protein